MEQRGVPEAATTGDSINPSMILLGLWVPQPAGSNPAAACSVSPSVLTPRES